MGRSRNILTAVVFLLGCIFLAGSVVLTFFLPSYIEKEGTSRIRESLGSADFSLEVRRVGMTGIDLGGLVLGPVDAPGVAFSGLRLDFSPMGLAGKRIRRAVVTGLTVRGRYENNQVTVPGLPVPGVTEEKSGPGFSLDRIPMPVEIGEVMVQGGLLILEHEGGTLRLPFDLTLFPKSAATLQAVAATLVLHPMGHALEINGALDLGTKKIALSASGVLPLAAGSPFVARMVPDLEIAGTMTLGATAELSLEPVRVERFRVESDFHRTTLSYPGISLGSGRVGTVDAPVRLVVEGDESDVGITLADVAFRTPYAFTAGTQARLVREGEGALAVHGQLTLAPVPEAVDTKSIALPLPLAADFSLGLDREKNWQVRADGKTAGLEISGAGTPVLASSGESSFAVSGKGREDRGRLDVSMEVPRLEIAQRRETVRTDRANMSLRADFNNRKINAGLVVRTAPLEIAGPSFSGRLENISLTAEADIGGEKSTATVELKSAPMEITGPSFSGRVSGAVLKARGRQNKDTAQWQGDWDMVLGAVDGGSGEVSAHLPGLNLSGSAEYDPSREQVFFVAGDLAFAGATAAMADQEVNLAGISGALPFQWPAVPGKKAGREGKIAISAISWQRRPVGSLAATILQQGERVSLDGRHANTLVPGLTVLFKGSAGIDSDGGAGGGLDFTVPLFTLGNFAPAAVFPEAGGLVVSGDVQAAGSVTMAGGRLDGSATLGIARGRVEDFEKKLLVEDISFDLVLPELPRIRSGPAQLLSFSRASFGEIRMDRGEVSFQIESPSSIFVEKGDFSWSRGYVHVYALRIMPEKSDYAITLYCDRLNFAQVLKQFGVAQVSGEGTVNGRIPLTITAGNIHFDDGFLYSSPGEGGEIRMEAAEMLSAGIPRNTPQFAQIDFAASALKNFKYNWVRLLFQSEGNDLVMRMRLDGKPAERLPFAYQRDIGSFMRLEAGSKEGIMQPILLDANFRLPFNTLLGYSSNINELLKKMQ